MKFSSYNGERENSGIVFWTDGMNDIWCDCYFTPMACNICDDVFAECADVVLMDVWLLGYMDCCEGYNLAIVRHPGLNDLFRDEFLGKVSNIDMKYVIKSQQPLLKSKRSDILLRYKALEN